MPNRYISRRADDVLEDIVNREKYLNRSGVIEFLYDFYIETIKGDKKQMRDAEAREAQDVRDLHEY